MLQNLDFHKKFMIYMRQYLQNLMHGFDLFCFPDHLLLNIFNCFVFLFLHHTRKMLKAIRITTTSTAMQATNTMLLNVFLIYCCFSNKESRPIQTYKTKKIKLLSSAYKQGVWKCNLGENISPQSLANIKKSWASAF